MVKQPTKGRKTPAKSKAAAPKKVDASPLADETRDMKPEPVVAPVPEQEPAVDVKEPSEPQAMNSSVDATQDSHITPVKESKKPTVMPAIFGGLAAGAIGFGVAYLVLPKADTTLAARVSAQSSEIAGLQDAMAAIPVTDLSDVEAAQGVLAAQAQAMNGRITDLEARLDDLSARADDGGAVSTAAYAQELDALRAEMENLRGTAVAELGAARDAAASIEANAEAAALAAAGRAALSRIEGALETGAPMGAALDDLAAAIQADVPAELTAVRDGAPTLASLQASFPEFARAALATARSEGASGEPEGGLTAFLRNQLDIRSVAPKEGASADAVLSRAEAALKQGRLTDTLAEVGALPEVARAELTEWQGLAEARADALAAAATLATSLNNN